MEFNYLKGYGGLGNNWTHVISGNFGGTYHTDLLLYDRASGVAEFWVTDGLGGMNQIRRYTNWSRTWTHIVSGNFNASPYTDLAFYDSVNGLAAVYSVDGPGSVTLMQQFPGWSKTWTHLVAGNFVGSGFSDLYLYDRSNGVGTTYLSDGLGGLRIVGYHQTRRSWDLVVPGNFGGNDFTDLLFYDRSAGIGEFQVANGAGQFTLMRQHFGWRRTWGQIMPGNFGGDSHTDLLFYEPGSGFLQFYQTDGQGNYKQLLAIGDQRKTWGQIVPGFFGGIGQNSGLFFYDSTVGEGVFYLTEPPVSPNMPWVNSWQGRENGRLSADPTGLWRSAGMFELYGRGADGLLYRNTWNSGQGWTGWGSVGDATILNSSPAVASNGPEHVAIFAADRNRYVIQKTWTATGGWAATWENRDQGVVLGDPAAISREPGTYDLFVRSGDNYLWHDSFSGGQWSGWKQIDNRFLMGSSPAAVALNKDQIFVFATDPTGVMHWRTRLNGTWMNWESMAGARIIGKPSAVVLRGSVIYLIGRGFDNRLWRATYYSGKGWTGWMPMSENIVLSSSPLATHCPTDTGRYDVYAADFMQNNLVVQKSFSG